MLPAQHLRRGSLQGCVSAGRMPELSAPWSTWGSLSLPPVQPPSLCPRSTAPGTLMTPHSVHRPVGAVPSKAPPHLPAMAPVQPHRGGGLGETAQPGPQRARVSPASGSPRAEDRRWRLQADRRGGAGPHPDQNPDPPGRRVPWSPPHCGCDPVLGPRSALGAPSPFSALQDAWSDQKGQIHLDEQQDYQLLQAQRTPEGLSLLFKRPFSTCDPQDYLIEVGGPWQSPGRHGLRGALLHLGQHPWAREQGQKAKGPRRPGARTGRERPPLPACPPPHTQGTSFQTRPSPLPGLAHRPPSDLAPNSSSSWVLASRWGSGKIPGDPVPHLGPAAHLLRGPGQTPPSSGLSLPVCEVQSGWDDLEGLPSLV